MAKIRFDGVPSCYWRDEVKMSHVEKRTLAAIQVLIYMLDKRYGDVTVREVEQLKENLEDYKEQLQEMYESNPAAAEKTDYWYVFKLVIEEDFDDLRGTIDLLTAQDRLDVDKAANGLHAHLTRSRR